LVDHFSSESFLHDVWLDIERVNAFKGSVVLGVDFFEVVEEVAQLFQTQNELFSSLQLLVFVCH
jgi:hypothetical protein